MSPVGTSSVNSSPIIFAGKNPSNPPADSRWRKLVFGNDKPSASQDSPDFMDAIQKKPKASPPSPLTVESLQADLTQVLTEHFKEHHLDMSPGFILKAASYKLRGKEIPISEIPRKKPPANAAKLLEKALWDQVVDPLVKNPEAAKKAVNAWAAKMEEKSFGSGVEKTFGVKVAKYLREGANELGTHPEHFRTGVRLFAEIMETGGFDRLNDLDAVRKSPVFLQADGLKRGQLLLEALGTVFVKAVQAISTMPDMFDAETKASMQRLYEDITPLPYSVIEGIIKSEFGKPVAPPVGKATKADAGKYVYASFDPVPLKAGSIAQIHKARLFGKDGDPNTGPEVVVKIVKPGVENGIDEDFDLLMPCIRFLQEMHPEFKADEFFESFREMYLNECQMPLEGANLKQAKEIFFNHPNLRVPRVFDAQSSKRVLTMDMMPGKSMLNFQGDKEIAMQYLTLMTEELFEYGFVQADPHPANVLYSKADKKFSFIDAGLVYKPDPQDRLDLIKMALAVYSGKPEHLMYAFLLPGYENQPGFRKFEDKLEEICARHANRKLDGKSFLMLYGEVTKVAADYKIPTVRVNEKLVKTLFTAVTVAKEIHPDASFNFPMFWKIGKSIIKDSNSKDYQFLTSIGVEAATGQLGNLTEKAGKGTGRGLEKLGEGMGNSPVGNAVKKLGKKVGDGSSPVGDVIDRVTDPLGEILGNAASSQVERVAGIIKNPGETLGKLLKRRKNK